MKGALEVDRASAQGVVNDGLAEEPIDKRFSRAIAHRGMLSGVCHRQRDGRRRRVRWA
jgi:hypothetical protein